MISGQKCKYHPESTGIKSQRVRLSFHCQIKLLLKHTHTHTQTHTLTHARTHTHTHAHTHTHTDTHTHTHTHTHRHTPHTHTHTNTLNIEWATRYSCIMRSVVDEVIKSGCGDVRRNVTH